MCSMFSEQRALRKHRLLVAIACFVLAGVSPAAPVSENDGALLQTDVRVEVEECLDELCTTAAPMPIEQAIRLETTLWNRAARRGVVVLGSRYRQPNVISFGDVAFDQVTFGPTRTLEQVYAVDRLTFWDTNRKPFVERRGPGRYVVRLPRRTTTFLLALPGLSLPSPGVLSSEDAGIVAVPELFGFAFGFLGLLETPGRFVSWNGKVHAAFPKLTAHRSYEIRLKTTGLKFTASARPTLGGIRWRNAFDVPSKGVSASRP